ncbi:MAG: hypothetical protein A3E84_02050 [Gammaproteobacteria bacterium RIFCSPHIGHO2_12_FULL_42_13]|nr:MAG: hypothetical protein A3E84_02050 [Gammaproteobacteria bacterium RIFCSPHIGHO2_12_FULL_42_13]
MKQVMVSALAFGLMFGAMLNQSAVGAMATAGEKSVTVLLKNNAGKEDILRVTDVSPAPNFKEVSEPPLKQSSKPGKLLTQGESVSAIFSYVPQLNSKLQIQFSVVVSKNSMLCRLYITNFPNGNPEFTTSIATEAAGGGNDVCGKLNMSTHTTDGDLAVNITLQQ